MSDLEIRNTPAGPVDPVVLMRTEQTELYDLSRDLPSLQAVHENQDIIDELTGRVLESEALVELLKKHQSLSAGDIKPLWKQTVITMIGEAG